MIWVSKGYRDSYGHGRKAKSHRTLYLTASHMPMMLGHMGGYLRQAVVSEDPPTKWETRVLLLRLNP